MSLTLTDFKDRLDFYKISYGTWRVYWNVSSTLYRTGITHDSLAVDRINSDVPVCAHRYGYTLLQAYCSMYSCLTPEFRRR